MNCEVLYDEVNEDKSVRTRDSRGEDVNNTVVSPGLRPTCLVWLHMFKWGPSGF